MRLVLSIVLLCACSSNTEPLPNPTEVPDLGPLFDNDSGTVALVDASMRDSEASVPAADAGPVADPPDPEDASATPTEPDSGLPADLDAGGMPPPDLGPELFVGAWAVSRSPTSCDAPAWPEPPPEADLALAVDPDYRLTMGTPGVELTPRQGVLEQNKLTWSKPSGLGADLLFSVWLLDSDTLHGFEDHPGNEELSLYRNCYVLDGRRQ